MDMEEPLPLQRQGDPAYSSAEQPVEPHEQLWLVFAHLATWFTSHVFVVAAGVVTMVTGHGLAGGLLVVFGTALLIYGIATAPRGPGTSW